MMKLIPLSPRLLLLSATLLATLAAGPSFAPQPPFRTTLLPTMLRTEYKVNPLGIDAMQPRLSWQLQSVERGALQTGYQIQVALIENDLRRGRTLTWDTERVSSDQSLHVPYEGPALTSGTRYFWRVRVWDRAGKASAWSEPAWWEMGLLRPSDWEATWIEPPFDQDPATSSPSPMLRRAFDVSGEVTSARLYVTSHGLYEMHLNGRRVGTELLTPGWTSYHDHLQYQTYDVTDLLRSGANALGAILGDGWYRGFLGFQGARNQYGETLALLAQLQVTYADGRKEIVARTDEGWKASTGPVLMSDIYMGETYDARLEKTGWAQPGYDDGQWLAVRPAEQDKALLVAPTAPPVHRIQSLKPIAMLTTPGGDLVFDMGQNMVGWVRLRMEGPSGTRVTLRHAEVLDRDGNFYTDNLRTALQTTTYILKGGGEETYEPRFTFQGFRYVAVKGYPGQPTLDDLTGVVVHSDMPPTGHFESSHALINQLQHNIVWGQKGNFVDVPTDCPQRDERLGWTGDAQVFAPTACFNMDVAGFFTKWLRDVAADQTDEGSIPFVVPDVLNAGGATGWADAGVIVPWTVYQRFGDVRVLERQYDSMKAWIEFMRVQAAQDDTPFVWDTGFHFGDWLAFSSNDPAYPGATTSTALIATAYFAHSTNLVAQTARILGKDDEAVRYEQLQANIVAAFRDEFMTPRGRLSSDTQTAYVLALSFNLLPEDLQPAAARFLANDVTTRGHLTTGFLGTPDLMHILSRYGYNGAAFKLLLRTEYPSWLYPVTQDATTIWERWDGQKTDGTFQDVGMNSFNHYAYGAVGDWLYGVVGGLKAAAPGYKKILIAPTPGGGLTHARTRLQSMYGPIESSWVLDEAGFHLTVILPPNTTATIRLPQAERAAVTESRRPLAEATGVTRTMQDGTEVVLEIGAGRYDFAYESEALSALISPAFGIETPVSVLLADAPSRAILEKHAPGFIFDLQFQEVEDQTLKEVAQVLPEHLTEARLRAIDADLRQLIVVPERSFNKGTKLAVLLADAEARALLRTYLPALMDSPWLSQTMGFPLERAGNVTPIAVPAATLQALDQALREIK